MRTWALSLTRRLRRFMAAWRSRLGSRNSARRVIRVAERRFLDAAEHPDHLLLPDLEHQRLVPRLHGCKFFVGHGKRRADKQAKGNRKAHRILRGLLWLNYPPLSAPV